MFTYVIDSSRRRIDADVGALTSGAELLAGMESLMGDPAFDPAYGVLIDLRELQRAPSVAELADLANFVRTRAVTPDARRAFVTSSPVFYQLAMLFTKLARGTVAMYRVFRSIEQAESWLGGASIPDAEEE